MARLKVLIKIMAEIVINQFVNEVIGFFNERIVYKLDNAGDFSLELVSGDELVLLGINVETQTNLWHYV